MEVKRFNALYWWIDRWRKSTAFTDLTLEEQGAYRNLLDEATLRGGPLPNDARVLAKASGDATRWDQGHAAKVMKRFVLRADGWHNETLDGVLKESARRATKQRAYRQLSGNPVATTREEQLRRERARGQLRRAVASGRIVPQGCEICGAKAEGHHDDYDQPLIVRWLCKRHHDELHNRVQVTSSEISR